MGFGLMMALSVGLCFALACDTAFAGKIKYTYDGAGRLTAAQLGTNGLTTYLYDPNGNLLNQTTAPATNADVRITKASDFTGRTVGFNITYTLAVTNAGPTAATDVTVTDPLPFGVLLSSASTSQGSVSFTDHTVTADLGVLTANSSATVTIAMFHALTNKATNVATVAASSPDPNLANNTSGAVVTTGLGPINDSDSDGMPNWWETLHGLSAFSSSGNNGANGDFDGEGVRNFDEWIADTDPGDATSFFRIEAISVDSGVTMLQFQSSPIRRYGALFTADLTTAFTNLVTFNGNGSVMSITHTNGSGGFYQLRAEVP